MLPTSNCNRTSCLEELIGIESDPCFSGDCPPFFIEQLDGVELKKLAGIAGPADLSGKEYAKRLIKSAAMEMIGDIELLVANGYSLVASIGEVCSSCLFLNNYQAGGGIKIHNASLSAYSKIIITSLKILANATGDHMLIIDDGVDPKSYPVTLEANTIMPIILNYTTTQKNVNLKLQDQTVGLAQISCPTQSSCGCGVKVNPAQNIIQYSGTVAGMASASQYGFLACTNVGCSNDVLICEMIRQMPNLFGLTLLYKVGEKINNGAKLSLRNGRVQAQRDEIKDEEIFKFNGLYRKRMQGTPNEKGIRSVISDYLNRRSRDSCITCDTLNKTGWARG